MVRGVDLQQIPLIAALVEADAPLRVSDQLELRRLQLEVLHVEPLIHAAGVEENWWVGIAKRGRVNSRMPGWSKSSKFCDARINADSFFLTRFKLLRMYSTAVRLLSQMYSSSSVATVFPSVSSLL